MDESLTEPQERVLALYRTAILAGQRVPTLSEAAAVLEFRQPRSVVEHLKTLEKKGYVRRLPGSRGVELVGASSRFTLPVLGPVPAGPPTPPGEADGEQFDFQAEFGGDDRYMLRVRGTSMIDDHIADGDYVVIRRHPEANNGEEVVATVDGGMTLKVWGATKDGPHLLPRNKDMPPIPIRGRDVVVHGVLVGVVRSRKRKGRR